MKQTSSYEDVAESIEEREDLTYVIEQLKKEFGNYIQDIDVSFRPSSQKQETFKSY